MEPDLVASLVASCERNSGNVDLGNEGEKDDTVYDESRRRNSKRHDTNAKKITNVDV